jgi:hypothetical protein
MGGFSESDLVVLTNKLNQDLSHYDGPDVKLVVSPVNHAVAPANQLACLQLPTPDALTRSGDSGGHNQRSISRILRARPCLVRPSPPDFMRVISGTGHGALALFPASCESILKVSLDCCTMAAHWVLGLIAKRASHVRKCPRCYEAPSKFRGYASSSTVSGAPVTGERSTTAMLMDHISHCPCSWHVIQLRDRIVHVLEVYIVEAGATKGRDLRLEVRRIRSGASRDRYGDVD